MPGTNLTRDEAAARAALLRVHSYEIELDLSTPDEVFSSQTTIRFAAASPGAESFVDLIARSVHRITLNGRELDPAQHYADGRIALPDLAAENELIVDAACVYMNTGEGLHRSVDPADGNTYLYTNFEMPDARRVYASFEQPDLRASFAFTITAPSHWTVLSNSPTPTPQVLAAGDSRWEFAPTPRISTYLTAIAAGPYRVVRDEYVAKSGQVVPLGVACRSSLAPHVDPEEIFAVTKQGFEYFMEMFEQPYPFDKYDQIFVPEYNLGAMENVGLVTITEDYVFRAKVTDAARQDRAETILHELAHMWFGDLVTMRWWDDLWLKESFATYVSLRCLAERTPWHNAWTSFANQDKAWGLRQDQLPSTHPIVAAITDLEDVQLNFDGITYAKGAAVLKQLVAWVGSAEFFAGVRNYFQRHAWGAAELGDLLAALEETSGRDLSAWSREWLQTAGPNTLRPSYTLNLDGTIATFAVLQEAPAEHPTLRSHRIAIGLYGRDGEHRLVRRHRVELDVTGPRTEVPSLVGQAGADLVLLNDDDLTYCTLRLDEHSLSTVVSSLGDLVDPLARALCWSAAWDMVRHAELPARDFISLILNGIRGETSITVIQTLHRQLWYTLDFYLAPEHREAARVRVAAAARQWLHDAEPGGDVQLAWARLFGRLARTEDEVDLAAGLVDGSVTIPGLDVDSDLRWVLVAPLVRAGRAGEAEIETELARDRTVKGEENAAGLRAARPLAEAKEWAFTQVVESDRLPNRTQDAIVGWGSRIGAGFLQSSQRELLAPFVDRYFAALDEVWRTRTLEIARVIVVGLYPRLLASPELVAATDAYLARDDVPAGLRRMLLEARDDTTRALAAQAVDAAAS